MRKPRSIIILLVVTFAVVGFSGQVLVAGKSKRTAIFALNPEWVLTLTRSVQRGTVTLSEAAVAPTTTSRALVALPESVPPQQLSTDANALVTEMCDLQLLAYDTSLTLDSRQWSALAAVVLRTQAIRQTYEAQIATSQVIAPGFSRVEIPVYASVGDLLREKFYTGLRTELGEATTADVLAKLGDKLEARFAGFGVSVQTLEITGNPVGALSDVQVTRTEAYWNSVDGRERLTIRCETHFPAWEDPTGDSWSALLALVKA